jgi:hypothetical protein
MRKYKARPRTLTLGTLADPGHRRAFSSRAKCAVHATTLGRAWDGTRDHYAFPSQTHITAALSIDRTYLPSEACLA